MKFNFIRAVMTALIFFIGISNFQIVYATIYENFSDGYSLNLPDDMVFDYSYSPVLIKAKSNSFYVTISKEVSPYDDVDSYIDYYLNRFILNENWQQNNRIVFKPKADTDINGYKMQIIEAVIDELPEDKFDGYTYVTIKAKGLEFYRIMFKYFSYDESAKQKIDEALQSFKYFKPTQSTWYNINFFPVVPDTWSQETLELYNKIKNYDEIQWGIFTKDIYGFGIDAIVPDIEKKLEYEFPFVLSYMHLGDNFPLEFMQKNYENGKIVELTLQLTDSNNLNLYGYTPNLDIYRGILDDTIRDLAKQIKEFEHPFLFRLNNEMNSDWTSYSGVINMSDPEIYIDNWRRIYKIFQQEGVNNAIWIFNPNDRNYPPCNWNNFIAYYPGNDYVQMIGITGYNTGNYYEQQTGEVWREFKEIYDEIQYNYYPLFDKFPWIITEFASSSIGGNKVKWIDNMFKYINNYKNIKIAVWFSSADYDENGKAARPYWLNENYDTLWAFKRGLK